MKVDVTISHDAVVQVLLAVRTVWKSRSEEHVLNLHLSMTSASLAIYSLTRFVLVLLICAAQSRSGLTFYASVPSQDSRNTFVYILSSFIYQSLA